MESSESESRVREALAQPAQPKEDPATVVLTEADILELTKGHVDNDTAKLMRRDAKAGNCRVFREDVLRFLGDTEAAEAEKAKRMAPVMMTTPAAPLPLQAAPVVTSKVAEDAAKEDAARPVHEPKPAPETFHKDPHAKHKGK